MITKLGPNEIFVFGSNLRGLHGGGAAKFAMDNFDAAWGCGEGPQGQCYAIPTKATPGISLTLTAVQLYVEKFLDYARSNPKKRFLMTEIGCGLAGFTKEQIAPLFKAAPQNVMLPPAWCPILGRN